jgi:hypothetical protein
MYMHEDGAGFDEWDEGGAVGVVGKVDGKCNWSEKQPNPPEGETAFILLY